MHEFDIKILILQSQTVLKKKKEKKAFTSEQSLIEAT